MKKSANDIDRVRRLSVWLKPLDCQRTVYGKLFIDGGSDLCMVFLSRHQVIVGATWLARQWVFPVIFVAKFITGIFGCELPMLRNTVSHTYL